MPRTKLGTRSSRPWASDVHTTRPAPEVLKAVVRERDNKVGVYGTVIRCGRLAVGQTLYFSGRSSDTEGTSEPTEP